jgi:hypothetical protein
MTNFAYYQGAMVQINWKKCHCNGNGTPMAAIIKTEDKTSSNDLDFPKEVPFDNLSWPNGVKKDSAMKEVRKIMCSEKSKGKKNKTVKRPAVTNY